MNKFSIRDIENLCGVKAHTLRIWEQRYKLCVPKRKQSQHRKYDSDELKELLQVCFLYHNGYKISRIAALSREQIQEEVSRIKPQGCNYELFVHQLIESSLTLDKEAFEKIINNLIVRIGLDKCIVNVFYPFLQRIGLLWLTNHVLPAQEHFSSNIIREKIISAIDGLGPNAAEKNDSPHVVIFSPPGELHEIPLLVLNYFLKKKGIRTTYFGTSVSIEALQDYFTIHPATHLYMHVITQIDGCGLNEYICEVSRTFPDMKVLVSGPACTCLQRNPLNLLHLHSLNEAVEHITGKSIEQ